MKKRLSSSIVDVALLSPGQIDEMYELFTKYYEGVSFDGFLRDLKAKNKVILLKNSKKMIVGFSTILDMELEADGKLYSGVFSGDTIVDKEYWGASALQLAFIGYLVKKKLRRPWKKVYWFLISKGYKTYLLMANNFAYHWPRFEKPTPSRDQKLMHAFASTLYPENYNEKKGVISFGGIHDRLGANVAPITQEMKESSPRIAFFERMNPSWQQGQELVCMAELDLGLPIRYGMKALRKLFKGPQKAKDRARQGVRIMIRS